MLSTTGPYMSSAAYNLANGASAFTRYNIRESAAFLVTADCDNSLGCSNSQMNNYCVANYGPLASFASGGYCSGRGNCGQCRYVSYLSEYCVVMNNNENSPFTESSVYGSCFYPFGANDKRYIQSAESPLLNLLHRSQVG